MKTYLTAIGLNAMLNVVEGVAKGMCDVPECHASCHEIGRQLFHKFQKLEILVYLCGKSCGNACFHGGLRQWVAETNENGTIVEKGKAKPTPYNAFINYNMSVLDSYYGGDLYHALGHAFLENTATFTYTEATECTLMPTIKAGIACARGFYMEYFTGHENNSLPDLYPCNSIDVEFPALCFEFLMT